MQQFEIDRNATVFAEVITEVAAPPEALWSVLTDIAEWPEFTPGVSAARLEGPLAPGSIIHWCVNGMELSLPLALVDAPNRLVWHSHGTAVHSWSITATETGCTLENQEALQQPFAGKTAEATTDMITAFLTRWNDALGKRAREII